MIGIGKGLQACFDNLVDRQKDHHTTGKVNREEDIGLLAQILLRRKCFSFQKAGRCYTGFQDFELNTSLKNIDSMVKRLKKHKALYIQKRSIVVD